MTMGFLVSVALLAVFLAGFVYLDLTLYASLYPVSILALDAAYMKYRSGSGVKVWRFLVGTWMFLC